MMSFGEQTTQMQDMANDNSSTALTFLKRANNTGLHLLESELGTHVIEEERTGLTVISTNYIELPENCIRVQAFFVTVNGIEYNCQEVFDEDTWRALQQRTTALTSNSASHFYVRRNRLYFYPTPATANTYTLIYEAESKDLQYADYTTGTISTLANLGTAVTGVSTAWTSVTGSLIGRSIRINNDGQWYEITAVGSATGLTIRKPYQGVALSAATASYTIGEFPKTPGPTHHIPVYYALWQFFSGPKKDAFYSKMYKDQWTEYLQWAKSTYSKRYSSNVIPDQRYLRRASLLDPNTFAGEVT